MNAGIPGVGIGGVYYMLLIAWMPVRALRQTLQGRGDPRRWRQVGVQAGLLAAILTALTAEWWALARLPAILADARLVAGPVWWVVPDGDEPGVAVAAVRLEYLAPTVVAAPFAIVGAVLASLRLLRLYVHRAPSTVPPATAEAAGPDRPAPDHPLGTLAFASAAYAAGLGRAGEVARTPDR